MINLDDLDLKIMRELGGSSLPHWNVRESYARISRRLGIDEETIRMRVSRAKERGFLPVWWVMANPLLFDHREANLDLEVKDGQRKTEAISKIRKVDGVSSIVDFRGNELLIQTYFRDNDALATKVKQIETICGSTRLALWNNPFIKPQVQMSRLDWRILDAIRLDARRNLEEVARSLGVSLRTVQRKLAEMEDGRAVHLFRPPNVNVIGGLMCNFLVRFSGVAKKRVTDYVIHSTFSRIGAFDTSPEMFSMFGMSCENFSEADAVIQRLRSMDGVTDVRMRIVKEIIITQDWVKNQIATLI